MRFVKFYDHLIKSSCDPTSLWGGRGSSHMRIKLHDHETWPLKLYLIEFDDEGLSYVLFSFDKKFSAEFNVLTINEGPPSWWSWRGGIRSIERYLVD